MADTPLGRLAFLICGDLFDDEIVARASASGLDLLLFPFARSFEDESHDQARRDADEMPAHTSQVARLGAPTAMVNLPGAPDADR